MPGEESPANGNVPPIFQGSELFPVVEDAKADRALLDPCRLRKGADEDENGSASGREGVGLGAHIGRITDFRCAVNGELTGCRENSARSNHRAMTDQIQKVLARIDQRLAVLHLSDNAASLLANKPDAIRNMRRAVSSPQPRQKGVSVRTLQALAPVLGTTVTWLMGEEDHPVNHAERKESLSRNAPVVTLIPVKGEVAAGRWFVHEDAQHFDPVPASPEDVPDQQFAFRVSGNSMDQKGIRPGDYVICIPYWARRSTITNGDVVVVEMRRGSFDRQGGEIQRTVKQVVVTGDGYELVSRSSDPYWIDAGPIRIARMNDGADAEGTEIEIVGLVIGTYARMSHG